MYLYLPILFFLIFSTYGVAANADINYSIDHYSIRASIDKIGGMDITEVLNYDFKDKANGIFRDLEYKNAENTLYSGSGISNLHIYELNQYQKIVRTYKLSNAQVKNGTQGVYTITPIDNGIRLKVFSPANYNKKYFMITYHVSNVVAKYRDTADFYWRFIGPKWESDLNDVSIIVSLPEASDKLRFFSHGPLSGTNSFMNYQTVKYYNANINAGDSVSLRLLFPGDIAGNITGIKNINSDSLNATIASEESLAKKANVRRSNINASIALAILWPILCICIYIFLYKKHGTRPKQNLGIITTPPDNYGPAFTEYVNGYNAVGPHGITAEIMSLVWKKYAIIEEELPPKNLKSAKADSRVTLIKTNTNYEYPHEAFLVDWFFNKIGDGRSMSFDEIKKYSQKNSSTFNKDFVQFKKIIKDEALKLNLRKEKTIAYKGALLFFIFSTLTGGLLGVKYYMYEFLALSIISSLLVFLLSLVIKKPTLELAVYKEKWSSYKNYLKRISFNKSSDKASHDLEYWEQALIFMIIFGSYKDGIKRLQGEYSPEAFADTDLTYLHHSGGGYYGLNTFSTSVASSVANLSSTSGLAGGGSSAGGAGGGGGGGGAF